MNASIIAVGTELLGSTRLESNSRELARVLEGHGIQVVRKSIVGDDRDAIGRELRFSLASSEIVLITGGLGPTEDDVTKEAVAAALGLELHEDPEVLAHIRRLFERHGLKMAEVNARQARVFPGQKMVANKRGTAPGFHLKAPFDGHDRDIWIFPGVPFEMMGMIEGELEGWLSSLGQPGRVRRVVKLCGLAESEVEEKLAPFYAAHHIVPTILASRGEVEIHLEAEGDPDESYGRLNELERELRAIFGKAVFGLDGDTMEGVVGRLLSERGMTVATAESCTGGLLASRITDVSGSSAYFLGGVVAYTRDGKLFLLGVDPAAIDTEGEVSEEVATQMARGAHRRFGSTYGIGITGIAGPTGGTEAKPVGTVHIVVASPDHVRHRRMLFHGSREIIKRWATQVALDMLRREIGE